MQMLMKLFKIYFYIFVILFTFLLDLSFCKSEVSDSLLVLLFKIAYKNNEIPSEKIKDKKKKLGNSFLYQRFTLFIIDIRNVKMAKRKQ
jgi:hypothetical protein